MAANTRTPSVARRRATRPELPARGIVSSHDRRRPSVRGSLGILQGGLLVALVVVGLGPILWLAKAAVTPTQETLRDPLGLFPTGVDWANLATAWTRAEIDHYFVNTLIVAVGAWFFQILVATTGGYVLSVLRPRYGNVIFGLVLATLFVPSVVLLVPLYLTILDLPIVHVSLLNTFWAVWLPMGASAFNVLLVKRFFDGLPREIFEAARVDGAGPFRLLWSIVLPMSKPILGVVSVFAVIAAWKDYLWPLLVLPDPAHQPLSVRLPAIAPYLELDVFLAALAISTVLPIALFLAFQRLFLSGAGLGGAVKG
ncbi:carbohydrate ABC transporter permease [Promicromonospora iranensis]|uniref:Multiple sugar transport system permease protein n=1 Tax=Promicromonospora iranensis TaxID=1105144 RepID=A0ABU2CJB2_9MICO|nr:carbohydrate ABC transporter permease [Promicromonospora iranensis]MDR7381439.1 multiple sugar transport system permease protein [Promicromonospora iranensis]